MDPLVIARKDRRAGVITLNASANQNRLSASICKSIISALNKWINDDSVELVIIDHADGIRGFSSGSDLSYLAHSGCKFDGAVERYLTTLSRLINSISVYPKPIVTFMDGFVRSSAVGLAINGRFQIATERTSLSFPDTGYGIVPHAGVTKKLSELPNQVGVWLALTGSRLRGADVVAANLATHFCESTNLRSLKAALQDDGVCALESYGCDAEATFAEHIPEIESAFDQDCAKEIMYNLGNSSSWSKSQATKIGAKSPLSTKIALRQIRTGRFFDSVSEDLRFEYRITSRLAKTRNFREGVRAILDDMDYCPDWKPSSLMAASFDRVAKFFSPEGIEALDLSRGRDPLVNACLSSSKRGSGCDHRLTDSAVFPRVGDQMSNPELWKSNIGLR